MEALYRWVSGLAVAGAALLAPAAPLVVCAVLFIGVDFVTGTAADYAAARRAGLPWRFESRKAWRTVVKLALAVTAVGMSWLLDACLLGFMQLRLARVFTGFLCGVEFWSFLENAARLSGAPLFRWLQRFVGYRLGKEAEYE